jgi:asparagine synthase (glutamine-hydrolysing)
MCGICGIINFNNQVVRAAPIQTMMQIMKHRGPDDEGVFLKDNVGLGFVRLSIIDLSPAGHQPMVTADERYAMVFNGEIYNYIELRGELQAEGVDFITKTDSEVLLKSYIQWGEACLHRFNGMWAFVIFDRKEKRFFAARDRFGIKPFYYIHSDNYFAFCSEIPPLLTLLRRKPRANYQSIFDYLVFNRTDQTECTFFEEVKKLQHGQHLSIIDGNVSINKWYSLRDRVAQTEGFTSPLEFRKLLSSAIGLRLRSDVPVGVCFSGGLDSSSIVSLLLQDYHKSDLNTFSAVYQKGQKGDETEFINEYTPLLKNMFFTTPDGKTLEKDLIDFVTAHAEPIPGTSPYAQFKVMELARDKVVVTLDGQGADEELAGYHYFFGFYFKELLLTGRFSKLACEMIQYLQKHKSLFGIKSFLYLLLPLAMKTKAQIRKKGYINPPFANKWKETNSIARDLYGSLGLKEGLLDHFEFKLEHLLKWEDRNSMFFSLESRVPFLDYRLVEKALATSSDQMIRNGTTKYLLRESMKGIMPEKIRNRADKIGFATPEDEWLRQPEWQKFVNDIFSSSEFKERKIIDTQKIMRQYKDHLTGKSNNSKEIWKCLHLELWFRQFID